MRVLVAMSGGVDSSVTAALLREQGHEVVGATMKLWGGASDSGCCSLSDVEDARRVAQQLGIAHHVFNFGEEFLEKVVDPYVSSHAEGRTPNPCIECNRSIKFDRFLRRATQLGFDAVATGHHVRLVSKGPVSEGKVFELHRGVDAAKDQSYVLYMLTQKELARCMFPIGHMTKAQVRDHAVRLGLRTATKPDSQDVCFITSNGGRPAFLSDRIPLRPGKLVDVNAGNMLGEIDNVELVTIGQRKGMGGGTEARRYAVDVDVRNAVVSVGGLEDLQRDRVNLESLTYTDDPVVIGACVSVQVSAHGNVFDGVLDESGVVFGSPQRRVAPGQSVVFYNGTKVLGGGIASS